MNNSLFIIGLTGPSGAGKSIVSAAFAAHGIPSVDTDAVYHALLIPPSPCLDALCEAFSPAVLNADGTLNRRALSALVFEDSPAGRERLQQLNAITHRYVTERTFAILEEYAKSGVKAAIIDAPLLLEAGLHTACNYTVAVLADCGVRKARLLARDGLSEAEIDRRIHAQKPDAFYREACDTVIENNGDTKAVQTAVDALCHRLQLEE